MNYAFIRPFATVLISLLCCSGCSQPPSDKSLCDLIDIAAASAAAGQEMRASRGTFVREQGSSQYAASCAIAGERGAKSWQLEVRLDATGGTSPTHLAGRHVATMRQLHGEDYPFEKISNLGDAAIWDKRLGQLTVYFGRFRLRVNGARRTDAQNLRELVKGIVAAPEPTLASLLTVANTPHKSSNRDS